MKTETSRVSRSTEMMPGRDDWTTPYESSEYDADTRPDKPISIDIIIITAVLINSN